MGTRIVVMRDGFIQQIDTPGNLYRYPCNQFVAGFIGTPQMNFFAGKLKKEDERVKVTLDGTEFALYAPAEYFRKVNKKYLDGETPVTIGIRAEHITTNCSEFPYITKCRVMNVEELGVNNQIYADFNMDASDIATEESPTRVILRAPAGSYYASGEVIDVAVDLREIHVFDAQTGENAIARIPPFAQAVGTVADGVLHIGTQEIPLPPALAVADGTYDLEIPCGAVSVGEGRCKAEILDVEHIGGTALLTLNVDGQILFATQDGSKPCTKGNTVIDIAQKQITLLRDGEAVAQALPTENHLDGTILKEKTTVTETSNGREKQTKKWQHDVYIGGHRFPCTQRMTEEIFSHVSEKICGCALSFRFPVSAAQIASDGMTATVEKILDYGNERYAVCEVGQTRVIVKTDAASAGDTVCIGVDVDALSVVEPSLGIQLI